MSGARSAPLGVALPAALLAVLVAPALPVIPLPDPVAVHWSLSGEPDVAAPRLLAALGPAAIWGAAWWLMARNGFRRPTVRAAFWVGGTLAAVQTIAVVANLGAPSWRDARRLSPVLVLAPLVAGLALGWLASRWVQVPPDRAPSDVAVPRSTERVVWVGAAANRAGWLLPAVIAVGAVAPLLGPAGDGVPVAPLLVGVVPLLLAGLLFSWVRVVIGPQAVLAGLGPWGWPRRRFSVADIRSASAEVVDPLARGGWGYRVGASGSSIIIRSGEALVLRLRDGGWFTVTVDGAGEAAAIVNGYLPGN